MRKLLLVIFAICFLTAPAYAWDGPWDINPVPYIKGKTAAPTVNDDTFIVPYLWVDETNDKLYILIDNTSGAAVWQEVIYSGGSPTFTSLTLTNPLTVPNGGTGASTLTDGGVLLGSGTGAVTPMAVLTDGQIIVGDGTTDPVAESGDTARISLGVGSTDSPTFTGLDLTGVADTYFMYMASGAVAAAPMSYDGTDNIAIQMGTDSTTGFQILDADGGTPVLNVDTTNERVGVGTASPGTVLHI